MSTSTVGLAAHTAETSTYAVTPTRSGGRRPKRSDRGPAMSWPPARPNRHAVTVSCAREVAAPSSAVRAGSAGR